MAVAGFSTEGCSQTPATPLAGVGEKTKDDAAFRKALSHLPQLVFALNGAALSRLESPELGTFKAFSGAGRDRNNPATTMKSQVGAIPKGRYFIVDRPAGGLRQAVGDEASAAFLVPRRAWLALYRDDAHDPQGDGHIDDWTRVEGVRRGNFRLHPAGFFRLSEGCVTLVYRQDFERLRSLLLSFPKPVLILPGTQTRVYGVLTVQ